MVQYIHATLLILAVATGVTSQFFDFYSAIQPLVQFTTPRPQYEITTKKIRTHNTRYETTRTENDRNRGSYNINRDSILNPSAIVFDETTKSNRKTTSNNSNRRNISNSNASNVIRNTRNNTNQNNNNRNTKDEVQRNRNDKIQYQDGRLNTVYNYETTKSYTTKPLYSYDESYRPNNVYMTQSSYRPGVKPAVTQGTPITNKPVTSRPNHRPYESEIDDTSITPELIIGPDEDYMTNVEKKRYIEMAETMCDNYKSLHIKQVEAIPLLPSPDSVKVNVSSCAPTNVPLVVGGKVVDIQEFPHMALLGWKKVQSSGYYWKCGGSLISDQYVLTAAHCAYQDRDNNVVMGPPRVVQLGSSYLNDPNSKIIKVTSVYRHPKYKQPKSYYDIAIVKMVNPITFSDSIKPACLGVPPSVDEPIIATGWGRTEFGGDQSNELRSVSIPVWDINECFDVLGTSRKIPDGPSSESQVCAGEKKGGKDTCQGDSGGPAQIQDGCVWRVAAVTSLGRSCGAPHTPALYALIPRAFVASIVFDSTRTVQNVQGNTNKQNTQRAVSNNNEANNYNNNNYGSSSVDNHNNNYNSQRNEYQSSSTYNTNTQRNDYQYSNTYNNNNNNRNQRNGYQTSNLYNNDNSNQRNDYQSSNINSNYNSNQRNDYTYNNNNQRNTDITTQRNYYNDDYNYNPIQNNNFGRVQNNRGYNNDARVWWT